MTPGSWPQRRPLLAFFGLTYVISWGCIALVLGVTGFDLANLRPLDTRLMFVSMLLGPSVPMMWRHLASSLPRNFLKMALVLLPWQTATKWHVVLAERRPQAVESGGELPF